jgi:hypothetical protein
MDDAPATTPAHRTRRGRFMTDTHSSGQTPKASRPDSPAGYWRSRPIPWRWAQQRLIAARNYWIVTVSPEGKPHARPVWGVLVDDVIYFDTGSRIGTHLMGNPDVTVHLESGDEVVIVEGTAERVRDDERTAAFIQAYNAKYEAALDAPPGALFAVRPRVAYGWVSDPTFYDAGAIFGSTGTRWDFE